MQNNAVTLRIFSNILLNLRPDVTHEPYLPWSTLQPISPHQLWRWNYSFLERCRLRSPTRIHLLTFPMSLLSIWVHVRFPASLLPHPSITTVPLSCFLEAWPLMNILREAMNNTSWNLWWRASFVHLAGLFFAEKKDKSLRPCIDY